MLRRLPQTITADQPPEWLPFGWLAHSTVLSRGRQTKTYTHMKTGKKFSTREHVIEYDEMYKVREKRESEMERRQATLKAHEEEQRHSWLPGDSRTKLRVDSSVQNPFMMDADTSTSLDAHPKEEVSFHQNTVELLSPSSEEEEATGCNQISYVIEEDEEELSESEYVDIKASRENVENLSTCLRSQPERLQKLESRAKMQCVFEDEEMSSESEDKLPEAKTSNAAGEESLHDVVFERVDKAAESPPGLPGSFTIEINLECGAQGSGIRDQDSDLLHVNTSSKDVEATQEPGDKSGEPLGTGSESRRSVIFPDSEAPLRSVLVFDNPNARPSAEDLSNTVELCSGKRKKNTETSSSRKKDTEAPTKKPQKGRAPRKVRKGSSNVVKEQKQEHWPEPCPYFPFEPLTSSSKTEEDDSVIRMYLEQHFSAVRNGDSSNLPLPDFGLPSFPSIIIIPDNKPEPKEATSRPPSGSSWVLL